MNIKTQVTVVALVLLAMVLLINRIRKNKLELKYSFMWFALGIGVIIFALVPELTAWLAGCMGIGQPINGEDEKADAGNGAFEKRTGGNEKEE
ncbi:MAG: DUF2304 domain-containing protein [Bacillota bacterium]|nr:DUF2304 domain-containing protein [Bacillota bacterium]